MNFFFPLEAECGPFQSHLLVLTLILVFIMSSVGAEHGQGTAQAALLVQRDGEGQWSGTTRVT